MPEQDRIMLPVRMADDPFPAFWHDYSEHHSIFSDPINVTSATVHGSEDMLILGEQRGQNICGVLTLKGAHAAQAENISAVFCMASGSTLKSWSGTVSALRERQLRWLGGMNIECSGYSAPGSSIVLELQREREKGAESLTAATWTAIYKNLFICGFSEVHQSPFLSLEYRHDPAKQTSDLIEYVRTQLDAPYREQLADRIATLAEPEDGERGVDPDSLRSLINFLQSVPELKQPTLSLSPDGNVTAIWRESSTRHFSAEFLPTGFVRFVVFRSNAKHRERVDRFSGITSGDTLIEVVAPHGVLTWARR